MRAAEVAKLEAGAPSSSGGCGRSDRRRPDARGARARLRAVGRAAVHRQGIAAWRRASSRERAQSAGSSLAAMDDRAVVARQLGRPPRAFGRVAVRCPFGRPAVTEQAPYDAAGSRSRRRTTSPARTPWPRSPGWRRPAAWSAGRPRRRPTPARGERPGGARRAAPAQPELAGAERGVDRGASLELGVGGAGARGQPQVPARARRLGARPAALPRSARPCSRSSAPLWPAACCTPERARRVPPWPMTAAIESARREWADADGALEREPDAERRRALLAQVEVVTAGCAGGSGRRSRSPSSPTRTPTPSGGAARPWQRPMRRRGGPGR